MYAFSEAEFEQMISEMDCENPRYDTLCIIAEHVIMPYAKRWCSGGILKGRIEAEDLMQNIHMRLIKKVVPGFLRNKRCKERINRDIKWFNAWLIRVAKNYTRDYIDALKHKNGNEIDIEELLLEPADDDNYFVAERDEHQREALTEAFNIVLGSDRSVYIVLTWIAQSLFVLRYDIKRPLATDLVLKRLRDKRLFDMWSYLMGFSKMIPWLAVTPAQKQRIANALCTPLNDGRLFGDVKYEEFFMRAGDKKSISDWVNRIDTMIESRMTYEPFDDE